MYRAATALALAIGLGAGAVSADVDPATIDAVKQLWEQQQKAFDAHDIDGVLATFVDNDEIMLMGTVPGEHWIGREEIRDAFGHFIQQFDPHTMDTKCTDGVGSAQGDVAWFTAVCSFTESKDGKPRSFVANLSAVVVNQDGGWRFHTMHYSQQVGGDQVVSQAASQ